MSNSKSDGSALLMLSLLTPYTGNLTTATRILNSIDTKCRKLLYDCNSISSCTEMKALLLKENVQTALIIHAYRSGRFMFESNIKYVLIFGGTDLSLMYKEDSKKQVMTKAVRNASAIVAFSEAMKCQAIKIWDDIEDRITVIPQGIDVSPSSHFNIHAYIDPHAHLHTHQHNVKVVTLVAGLQKVKDPCYLLDAFSDWHVNVRTDVIFVIVGCVRDEQYAKITLEHIDRCRGVYYAGALSMSDTHAAIQQSCALVNSSLHEGMCTAILEAFALQTPVIARDIPSNAALVTHRQTGLLYTTPQDFIRCLTLLLEDDTIRQSVTKAAKEKVQRDHNVVREAEAYSQLLAQIDST